MAIDYRDYANARSEAWAERSMKDNPRRSAGIRALIRALKAAGDPIASVHDGAVRVRVASEREALVVAHGVDLASLHTASGASVYLVMCNGDDVCDTVADWSMSIDPIVSPAMERYLD